MPKIVKYDGRWCIQEKINNWDKPINTIVHWPIGKSDRPIDLTYFENAEVEKTSLSYEYILRLPQHTRVYLYLIDGGKTQSLGGYDEDIPCPKVRKGIEVKFERGAWWKYLKSQGWMTA